MGPGMDHCGLPAQTGPGITEAGFDAYVGKPINLKEFLDSLDPKGIGEHPEHQDE